MAEAAVLIVDDNLEDATRVATVLAKFPLAVLAARTSAEARGMLSEQPRILAVLVDLILGEEPEEAAFDLIRDTVYAQPTRPCAAISNTLRRDFVNRVAMLGAAFIAKYDLNEVLPWFARQAMVADIVGERPLQKTVVQFAHSVDLTPRETEVLALASADATRDEIRRRLRIAPSTLKAHAASILRRARSEIPSLARLEDVAQHVRRQAHRGS